MTRVVRWLAWSAQPIGIVLVLRLALGGPGRDFRDPLVFSGDALFFQAQAKATIDHGWWWTNPSLGAPSELHAVLFPHSANVDQAIVRLVGLIQPNVMPAVTLSWLVMILLCGLTSAWCLRQLGVSPTGAWVTGALFTLSPFVLYLNTIHFTTALYLVPFAATAALRLAAEPEMGWRWRGTGGLVLGSLLLGFNSISYACFGAFFVALGAIGGAIRTRQSARLAIGGMIVGAIVLAAVVNLMPTRLAWQREGRPHGVVPDVADSELFGLKVRHLVSPLPDHWFRPFGAWAKLDAGAGFPIEREDPGSHLGLVAATGFLGLLAVLVIPSLAGRDRCSEATRGASRLAFAAVLLSTVGGFGSLFNLFVWNDIRSYTSITPFIAFFALAAVALWSDQVTEGRRQLRRTLWAGILAIGLLDQLVALRPLNVNQSDTAADFHGLRTLVGVLEQRLPAGAMVFQLPVRPYPLDAGVERMGSYDHFRPYLLSHTLRWSYPALSDAQARWQEVAALVNPRDLPAYLARAGFAAVLVDRYGYQDGGAALIDALRGAPGYAQNAGVTDRYAAFDVSFSLGSGR